jgi:putative membrane protein
MSRSFPMRLLFTLALGSSMLVAGCQGEGDDNDTTDTMPASVDDSAAGSQNPTQGSADTTWGTGTAPDRVMATRTDPNIAAALMMMDSSEVALGRIAVGRARNEQVKGFAQMMIDHHTQMMNEGTRAAQQDSITPMMQPDDLLDQEMVTARDRLTTADAASFDRVYMDLMVAEHRKAVARISQMVGVVKSPALRGHMERALPRVQAHLDHAQKIVRELGGTAAQ